MPPYEENMPEVPDGWNKLTKEQKSEAFMFARVNYRMSHSEFGICGWDIADEFRSYGLTDEMLNYACEMYSIQISYA